MNKLLQKPLVYMPIFTVLALFSSTPAFLLIKKGFIAEQNNVFFLAISIGAFLTMFILPSIFIRYVLNKDTSNYGLKKPHDINLTIKITGLATLLLAFLVAILSQNSDFRVFYETNPTLSASFLIEIVLSLLYFISEEFLFRGFFLFSLWEKLGYKSFLLINLIFAILHIAKAPGEIVVSFFAGITFSYLSIKTQSIWPAVFTHFFMAVCLNLLIFFTN